MYLRIAYNVHDGLLNDEYLTYMEFMCIKFKLCVHRAVGQTTLKLLEFFLHVCVLMSQYQALI